MIGSNTLISIRDPIERIISAFNWRYDICILKKNKIPCHNRELQLFKCYNTINKFAEGLGSAIPEKYNNYKNNILCRKLGRSILTNPQDVSHIGMGLSYYFKYFHGNDKILSNKTSHQNQKLGRMHHFNNIVYKKIFPIRTKYISHDLYRYFQIIPSGDNLMSHYTSIEYIKSHLHREKSVYEYKKHKNITYLSKLGKKNLLKFLKNNYYIYNTLLNNPLAKLLNDTYYNDIYNKRDVLILPTTPIKKKSSNKSATGKKKLSNTTSVLFGSSTSTFHKLYFLNLSRLLLPPTI